jgi:hypothetical protein
MPRVGGAKQWPALPAPALEYLRPHQNDLMKPVRYSDTRRRRAASRRRAAQPVDQRADLLVAAIQYEEVRNRQNALMAAAWALDGQNPASELFQRARETALRRLLLDTLKPITGNIVGTNGELYPALPAHRSSFSANFDDDVGGNTSRVDSFLSPGPRAVSPASDLHGADVARGYPLKG